MSSMHKSTFEITKDLEIGPTADCIIGVAMDNSMNDFSDEFKAKIANKKHLREFRLYDISSYKIGDEVKADIFAAGEKIDVQGTSKGKGFQGVIKRHGQHRGPMGHGSMYHRRPGSMGSTSTPGRVFKGKKLPGHMGSQTITIQNLEVVRVDLDKNVILVKGSVPGAKGAILKLKTSVKSK